MESVTNLTPGFAGFCQTVTGNQLPGRGPYCLSSFEGPRGNCWGTETKTQLHWSSKRGTRCCWPDKAQRPYCFPVTFCTNYQAGRKRSEHQVKSHRCRTVNSRHNLYLDKGTHINSRTHNVLDNNILQLHSLGCWPSALPKLSFLSVPFSDQLLSVVWII